MSELPVFPNYDGHFVTPYLAVGAWPRPEHAPEIAEAGIRGVLNLLGCGDRRLFAYLQHLPESVHWMHLGFWDGWLSVTEPGCNETLTPTYARFLVQRAAMVLRDHEPVLVHCGGGKSRAGNVAAILLAAREGIGLDDAIAQIQSRRPSVLRFNYGKYWKNVRASELVELAAAVLAEPDTPGELFCSRIRGGDSGIGEDATA